MPLILPNNPVDGETVPYGALRYTYFQDKQYWKNTQVLTIEPVIQVSGTTSVLTANQTTSIEITGFPGYLISRIQVSNPAWVRVYSSNVKMSQDQSRTQTQDPSTSSGVALEVISVENSDSYIISPAIYVVNGDSPRTDKIYARITNLSGVTTAVTVVLDIVKIGI